MKILLYTFLALLINSPLWAQAATNQLGDILRTQAQKAQQKTHSLEQVLQKLQNEKISHLSWQEFLKQNEHVKEVEKGYECGILVEGFKGVAEGDVIECFRKDNVTRRIKM